MKSIFHPVRTAIFGILASVCLVAIAAEPPSAESLSVPNSASEQVVTMLLNNGCAGTCACYFSTDCGNNQFCDYNDCTNTNGPNGKLKDGQCKARSGGGGSIGDLGIFADAVDLTFQAYLHSARLGSGTPDPEKIVMAQSFNLPAAGHYAAQNLVQDAMDLALGFDFIPFLDNMCGGPVIPFLGQGHGSPELMGLLESMHQGVVEALRSGDSSAIASSISSFYDGKSQAEIHPGHSGRCYPHGHRRYPYKGPEECHIKELTGFVEHYLN